MRERRTRLSRACGRKLLNLNGYVLLARHDFPAAMTSSPSISMMNRDPEPMLDWEPTPIHALTPPTAVNLTMPSRRPERRAGLP